MMIPDLPAHAGRATVLGVLLNHRSAWDALAPQMTQDPYKAPPKAPVLYIKPASTWVHTGPTHQAVLSLPAGHEELVIGATLGVVIGRATTGVSAGAALSCVAGYTLVIDATLPHASVYRPPLKYNCRDGYCPMGPSIVPASAIADPAGVVIHTDINGHAAAVNRAGELVRPIAQLIADISDFMTLHPGDVLLAGVAHDAARARAGDQVRVHATGVGAISARVVSEGEAS